MVMLTRLQGQVASVRRRRDIFFSSTFTSVCCRVIGLALAQRDDYSGAIDAERRLLSRRAFLCRHARGPRASISALPGLPAVVSAFILGA